jgi:hypothetical protein
LNDWRCRDLNADDDKSRRFQPQTGQPLMLLELLPGVEQGNRVRSGFDFGGDKSKEVGDCCPSIEVFCKRKFPLLQGH